MGWLWRTIVRQQQRAAAARGCMLLIFFAVMAAVGLWFGLPLLLHALPLIQKTS